MTNQQKLYALLGVIIFVYGGYTLLAQKSAQDPTQSPAQTSNTPAAATGNAPTATTTSRKTTAAPSGVTDGKPTSPQTQNAPTSHTYKETVTYRVPDGFSDTIHVSVTVDASGTITDATFSADTPSNPESEQYIGKFSRAFSPSLLVGKQLSGSSISKTGRASLTTGAYNQALQAIAQKA